jgi:hypothetical protein
LFITPPRPSPSLSLGTRSEADSSLGSSVPVDDGGGNTSDDISSLPSASTHASSESTDEPIAVRTRLQKVYAIQNNILMILSDMVCSLPQVNHIH